VAWVARNGREALTVPPRDAAALADAIRYLLDHPDEASKLGENGYARVTREFHIERFKQRTYAAYQEVLRV
jgi:rhamnosyl/mannosyltransferase